MKTSGGDLTDTRRDKEESKNKRERETKRQERALATSEMFPRGLASLVASLDYSLLVPTSGTHVLCSPFQYWIRAGLCDPFHMVEVTVCDTQAWVIKCIAPSASAFWAIFSERSQLPCWKDIWADLQRAHMKTNQLGSSSLLPLEWTSSEVQLLALVHHLEDWNSSQDPTESLLRELESELSNQLAPASLVYRTGEIKHGSCCFKPLNARLVVI